MTYTHNSLTRYKDEWVFLCNGKYILVKTKSGFDSITYCPLCGKNVRLELSVLLGLK